MQALSQELIQELNCKISFTIPIFGGIPVPESAVVTWIIIAALAVICFIFTRNLKVIPETKRQIIIETAVDGMNGFFKGILGEEGKVFIPIIETMAIYIGFSNLIGIFGLVPPTKDSNVTAGLAIVSIFLIEYAGVKFKGTKKFIKGFAEPMAIVAPLNVLEIFIRPLSLCMRLFGNILGGFVVVELVKLIIPVIVPIPFNFYFDLFDGLIQAYVFVFLTSLFIKESIE